MGAQVSGAEVDRWYGAARRAAIAAAVPVAELDWLLLAWSDLDRLALRLGTVADRPTVTLQAPLETLDRQWQRRLGDRVPVQYLAGRVTWRRLELQVSPAVLIPRPETELMVDLAIAWRTEQLAAAALDHQPEQWADLGTGSGAIAIALADAFPEATVWAIDRDPKALAIARMNAQTYAQTYAQTDSQPGGQPGGPGPAPSPTPFQDHGPRCPRIPDADALGPRLTFACGSWFEPLGAPAGQLTALVSNPPYIPTAELGTLAPEVIAHEPTAALDGGPDGLDCIRHLIQNAPGYLRPGGLWLVEHMAGQGAAIADLLRQDGRYGAIEQHWDLAGRDRFVSAETHPVA
jgi:release factor glutamine methyltransferase